MTVFCWNATRPCDAVFAGQRDQLSVHNGSTEPRYLHGAVELAAQICASSRRSNRPFRTAAVLTLRFHPLVLQRQFPGVLIQVPAAKVLCAPPSLSELRLGTC